MTAGGERQRPLFGHPQARYFSVGRIGRDQVADYARAEGDGARRGRALAAPEPRVRAVGIRTAEIDAPSARSRPGRSPSWSPEPRSRHAATRRERITSADQARAKAMLAPQVGSRPGSSAGTARDPDVDFYCAGLDESDLTLTGDAVERRLAVGRRSSPPPAQVYDVAGDANASWRRGTGAAGRAVLRERSSAAQLAEARRRGSISLRRSPFRASRERSIAYRASAGSRHRERSRLYVDLVVLQQSRAQAALTSWSVAHHAAKAEELRLARIVAGADGEGDARRLYGRRARSTERRTFAAMPSTDKAERP